MGIARYPTTAGWSVFVQGDSTRATVKATVRFATSPGITDAVDCSSTGRWETAFERQVKAAAEGTSSGE